MPIISCILSILIHCLIVVFSVYSPLSGHRSYIDLDKPVYEVELVRLPPAPSVLEKQSVPSPKSRKPKAVTSLKKKVPASAPKTKPPVKIAKQAPKKPAPESVLKKPEQSPEKQSQKKRKPPKPEALATPEKVLEEAMAEIKEQAEQTEAPPKPDYLAEAMADIEQQVQARGPDRTDSAQVESTEIFYGGLIKKVIKANWRFPGVDDSGNLRARVELRLNAEGRIVQSTLLESSGRPDFDRSVMKAIAETTQKLPVPKDIETIEITFHSGEIE